jgi:hypothetical protein
MRRLFVIVAALALAGCATFPAGRSAQVGSGEAVQVSPVGTSDIAKDVVRLLKQNYGPGQTVFIVPKENGPLGQAIDAELRSAGYGVSLASPAATTGTRLTYLVDNYTPGDIIVGIGAGCSFYAMRMYGVLPLGKVEAEGEWTIREGAK